jgi:hypothetical protein
MMAAPFSRAVPFSTRSICLAGTERCLTPSEGLQRRRVVQTTAIAVACAEKAQWLYEGRVRPAQKLHAPWIEHNDKQVLAGFEHLDGIAAKVGLEGWIAGTQNISLADVTRPSPTPSPAPCGQSWIWRDDFPGYRTL